MAWSTREIAELTGTTLRAVRHYHEVGLLEEPRRRSNGYKQYGVAHLVRVLRIKRLTDLGFSLSQIAELGDTDDHPEDALRTLDAELAATIERLQRIRLELAAIMARSVPTDLPPELAGVADAPISDADRSFMVVMSRVLGPRGMQTYSDVIGESERTAADRDLEELTEDADDADREDLARRLAVEVRAMQQRHPDMLDVHADAPGGPRFAGETMGKALVDLYNPAQIDVLVRINRLLTEP